MKRTKLIFMPLKNLVQGIGRGLLLVAILFAFGMNSALAQNYVGEQEATTILANEEHVTLQKINNKELYSEAEIKKARLKLDVIRAIQLKLKEGKTVAAAVSEVLGDHSASSMKRIDAFEQYSQNPKNGPNNSWLRQEMIELLSQ